MSPCAPIQASMDLMSKHNVKSILEVGCGKGGILAQFNAPVRVGIDNFNQYLSYASETYPGSAYIKYDVTHLLEIIPVRSFDAVIGFDILEHLPEVEMSRLIDACEVLARKLVIFFSPLDEAGLNMQPEQLDGNQGMKHVTIIRAMDFIKRGYHAQTFPNYHRNIVSAVLASKEIYRG